jgi:hypothetical protein
MKRHLSFVAALGMCFFGPITGKLPNPIPGLRTNAVRMAERGVQLVVPDREPRLRTTFRMTEVGI